MAKQDVEMKEAPKQNDTVETEEPQAEVSKEEKERLVLEGDGKCSRPKIILKRKNLKMYE